MDAYTLTYTLMLMVGGIGVIGYIAEIIMNYMGQRAVENHISMGIQAIIGVNNMNTIDRAMERRDNKESGKQ